MKLFLACVVLCASTIVAHAQQPRKADAEAAYKAGQALYMKEDYAGAAARFKDAYDLDPDPVYLFNVAQALRLAKQCKDASTYYQRYLTEAKKAPNEEAVKAAIVEVDECAKAQEPAVVTPPPVVEQAQPSPPPIQPVRTDVEGRGGKRRLVGYIVTGAGVGLAGLGGFFAAQISGYEDDAAALCPKPCSWTPEKTLARDHIDNKAHTREKLMVGSFIAGGAAIAAGVFLIVTGGEQRSESAVTITPTRNGALATFRF